MRSQTGNECSQLRAGVLALGSLLALCCFSAKDSRAQSAQANQSPDALHQLSSSVEELVKRVSPSVVQVLATGFGPMQEGDSSEAALVIGRLSSIGSGVIVDPDGYILTNAHVLRGAQRVQVILPSPLAGASPDLSTLSARGRIMEARIVGLSREIDLAVLKIKAKGFPALPIAKYSNLRQGEMVFAFGSPGACRIP